MVDHSSDDGHRALVERLLLGAFRDQDVARLAVEDGMRGRFLAAVSRDLAQSLEEAATWAAVARRTLPRGGSWCVVDIVELGGGRFRLPSPREMATEQFGAPALADRWFPTADTTIRHDGPAAPRSEQRAVEAGTLSGVLAQPDHMIVVPLSVRGAVLGAITFVIPEGDLPLSPEERALASDIADLCALALDNARLYRDSEVLRQMADTANRAKTTFLRQMSHELMTPLNAIGGYVTLMEMGLRGPVTADQQRDLARVRLNQAHLAILLADVLARSEHEGAQLQYRFSRVAVAPLLGDVVTMLQGSADEHHGTLTCVQRSGDDCIWADADRVRQVLLNVVMNAIKYGKSPGGTITIESTAGAETISIHVTDDGNGIPERDRERIFGAFVQLHDDAANRRGGVGLGLAISRDLARAMHGDLTVASTVGVGSRFTLELPREPAAPWSSTTPGDERARRMFG